KDVHGREGDLRGLPCPVGKHRDFSLCYGEILGTVGVNHETAIWYDTGPDGSIETLDGAVLLRLAPFDVAKTDTVNTSFRRLPEIVHEHDIAPARSNDIILPGYGGREAETEVHYVRLDTVTGETQARDQDETGDHWLFRRDRAVLGHLHVL